MKGKISLIFKVAFISLCCAVGFAFIAFVTLGGTLKSANVNNVSEPYYAADLPENCGILFNFNDGESEYLYFDFSLNVLKVILLPHNACEQDVLEYGYTVFRTVNLNYAAFSDFIDNLGGVISGETRYSGTQITAELASSNSLGTRRKIIKQLFATIKNKQLKNEDVVFLIENSNTDLSFPDGYRLIEGLNSATPDIQFVN